MRKKNKNRSIMMAGTAMIALVGCMVFMSDVKAAQPNYNPNVVVVENNVITEGTIPCIGGEGSCLLSDDYLVNQFSQTTETDDSYPLTNEDIMALSKPSGRGMVSVKEKQKLREEEDTGLAVVYTSLPLPEKITTSQVQTDVMVKVPKLETKAEVKEKPIKIKEEAKGTVITKIEAEPVKEVAEPVKVEKPEVKETVIEKAEPVEEVIELVKVEEKPLEVKEEVKEVVFEPVVMEPVKEAVESAKVEAKPEVEENAEPVKTEEKPEEVKLVEVTEETKTDIEGEPVAISESAPQGTMTTVPLKKIKTTITETTTKIKKEKKVVPDPKTLAEKVSYGQSPQSWEAKSGDTLRSLLSDWGNKAGWTVVWKLDRDYHLEAGVIFQGTFTDVSSALIRSFARATPAPIGTFYKGNRVLVINTQEDENER